MTNKQVKPNQPSTKVKPPKKDTPAKPRQKEISLKTIQAKQKEVKAYSKYLYNKETNEVISYNAKFNPVTTEKLLKLAYENMLFAEENNIDYFTNDVSFTQYIYLLIIKFYSKWGSENISDKLDEQIPQFFQVLETGLFELFFNEIFDPEEVIGVVDKVKSFVQLAAKLAELDEHARKEILESVESPFIRSKLEANNEAREEG